MRGSNKKGNQAYHMPNDTMSLKTLQEIMHQKTSSHQEFSEFFFHIYTLNRKEELCSQNPNELHAKLEQFEKRTCKLRGDTLYLDFGMEHGYKNANSSKTLVFNRPTCLQILRQAHVNFNSSTASVDQYFYTHDICGGSGEPNQTKAPSCAYVQLYHCDRQAYTTMLGGPFDKLKFFDCVFQNEYFETIMKSIMISITARPYRCRQEWRITHKAFEQVVKRVEQNVFNLARRRAFYAIPSELLAKFKKSIIYIYSYFAKLSSTRGYALSKNPRHRHFMYLNYVLLKLSTKGLTVNLRNAKLRKLLLGDSEDKDDILDLDSGARESFNIDIVLKNYNFLFFNRDQVDFEKMEVKGGVNDNFNHVAAHVIFGGSYVDPTVPEDEDPLLELKQDLYRLFNMHILVPKDIGYVLFKIFAKEMIAKIPKTHRCFKPNTALQRYIENTFDITSVCNYQIALSDRIRLRSQYERYRLYFDMLPIQESKKRIDALTWRNMYYLEEWMHIKIRFNKTIVKEVDQYLFWRFCKLMYLPCSYRDRIWSVYSAGKLLKILNMEELPKFRKEVLQSGNLPLEIPKDVYESESEVESQESDMDFSFKRPITPAATPVKVPVVGTPVRCGERGPLDSKNKKESLVWEDIMLQETSIISPVVTPLKLKGTELPTTPSSGSRSVYALPRGTKRLTPNKPLKQSKRLKNQEPQDTKTELQPKVDSKVKPKQNQKKQKSVNQGRFSKKVKNE